MKGKSRNLGQGILEFALVLPLLIIIAVGVLDLGRIFFGLITVSNASREGARYLSFTPDDTLYVDTATGIADPFHGTKIAAVNEAVGSIYSLSTSDVVASCSSYNVAGMCASGSTATVTVSYDLDLVAGWILPSPVTLTRSTLMVVP